MIHDATEESNICTVLQRSAIANSLLFLSVLIGLIFKVLIIFFMIKIFDGKFYRFTNFYTLVSGLTFNFFSVIWWIVINDLSFSPQNGIKIGYMFFVIPFAGAISLLCFFFMRTYTRMFEIAKFANTLMQETESSSFSSSLSSLEN